MLVTSVARVHDKYIPLHYLGCAQPTIYLFVGCSQRSFEVKLIRKCECLQSRELCIHSRWHRCVHADWITGHDAGNFFSGCCVLSPCHFVPLVAAGKYTRSIFYWCTFLYPHALNTHAVTWFVSHAVCAVAHISSEVSCLLSTAPAACPYRWTSTGDCWTCSSTLLAPE